MIRWWKLTDEIQKVFTKKLKEIGVQNLEGNINKMQKKIAEGVKEVAKEGRW